MIQSPPETTKQLARNLTELAEIILARHDGDAEWKVVLGRVDQLVGPQVVKALLVAEGYKRDKPCSLQHVSSSAATRSKAQHDFMSAVGLGSPRYQSPVQTRPATSAPSVASLPPPRTAISPRNITTTTTYKALISPGPGANVAYARSLSGVVSPPPMSGGLESPRLPTTPYRRPCPDSPAPVREEQPAASRSGSGYNTRPIPAPVPLTTPAPDSSPPRSAKVSEPASSVTRSVDRRPQENTTVRQQSGSGSSGVGVGEVLAKVGLGEYAQDFTSHGILTASQLYKQTGRDMQGLNLPTEVQTNILTLIRDYWIDLAARHRVGS